MKRLLSALVLLASVSSMIGSGRQTQAHASGSPRPNILFILVDDQRIGTISPQFTPNIWSMLVHKGVTYTHAYTPNPLCCPSRTSILTGLFSGKPGGGVWANVPPYGGFTAFDPKKTVATDLHAAGYRTGLFGKYLNGYPQGKAKNFRYVPPGWDAWFGVPTAAYQDFYAAVNGRRSRFYGPNPSDYATRIITSRALAFMSRSEQLGHPWFAYVSYTAPHAPATAEIQDVGRFASVTLPNAGAPSLTENVSHDGKPQYVRDWTVPSTWPVFPEHQLEAMYGVDRSLGNLLTHVPANTLIVYFSDNGFMWLEHGLTGKDVPYEESINVPMIVRWDGHPGLVPPDTVNADPVLNVDFDPTWENLAGVSNPRADGVNFLTRLRADRSFPITHYQAPGTRVPSYCGVRSPDYMFVQYNTGEQELYDMRTDPYQLTNLASSRPDLVGQLLARTKQLCSPTPPDWTQW